MSQQHRTTKTTASAPPISAVDQSLLALAIRRATQDEEFAQLCAMTTEQRQAAYAAGKLTGFQVRTWYADRRFAGEQPLTSLSGPGEFFHILCKTPEYLGE